MRLITVLKEEKFLVCERCGWDVTMSGICGCEVSDLA